MKIIIRIKILYILVCMIIIQSCVDPISFKTDSKKSQLAFYGNFTQLTAKHIFTISRTSDFGQPVIPVSGASVSIKDDHGICADYEEIESGIYELDAGQMRGIPGRYYHIEVTFPNGKTYYSTPQVMPEPIDVEDIYFKIEQGQTLSSSEIIVENTFINIYIDTPLQNSLGESHGIRWTVDEVYSFTDLQCHPFFDNATTCYFNIPVDESRVRLFKSEDGIQENLNEFKVHSRSLANNDEFLERHYFTVHQYTMTEESTKYWEQVNIVSNQSGNLFDLPPARIAGNIYEKDNEGAFVIGYFEVSGQNIVRTYTLPFLIEGSDIIETCPARRSYIVEDKCCFCWLLDEDENRIDRPLY